METKFTPAPWVVWGSDIGVVNRSDSQSNGMMLQVAYADMYNFGDDIGENNETGKANAHLIAAAPEMYDALESACSEIYSLINNINKKITMETRSDSLDPPDLIDMQTCHDIQLLLAKARGEL